MRELKLEDLEMSEQTEALMRTRDWALFNFQDTYDTAFLRCYHKAVEELEKLGYIS